MNRDEHARKTDLLNSRTCAVTHVSPRSSLDCGVMYLLRKTSILAIERAAFFFVSPCFVEIGIADNQTAPPLMAYYFSILYKYVVQYSG